MSYMLFIFSLKGQGAAIVNILRALIKHGNPNTSQPLYARQGRLLLVMHKDASRRKPVRVLSTAVNARMVNG